MSAPRIGLTTYGRNEQQRFDLPAEYVDAVRRAGGIPLLVPAGEERLEALLDSLDALVLTGGGDLDPARYGGARPDSVYQVDAERDGSELALTRIVLQRRVPCLAICRGMQVLNVALGGSLIEHLPDEVGEEVLHRLPPREPTPHPVHVDAGSRLAHLLGATDVEPVSWHHQAIRVPAAGLTVVARAPDGVIEAVEIADRPELVAVQWHPELSAADDSTQQRLFDWLVESGR